MVAVRVFHGPDDRVPAGVSIAGIPVGGLTAAQAERVVAARAEPPPREVEIVMPGEPGFPLRVPVAELAPTPRARLAVRAARCSSRRVTDRLLSEIGVRERTRDLPLRYRPDPSALDGRVAAIAARVDRPAVPAKVVVRSSKLEIAAAADGRAVDQAELRRRLARAAAPGRGADRDVVPPAVTDAAARLAYARAAALADRPVAVRGAGRAALDPAPGAARRAALQTEGGQIAVRLDRNAIVDGGGAGVRRDRAPGVVGDRSRSAGRGCRWCRRSEGRRLDGEAIAQRIEAAADGQGRAGWRCVPIAPERSTADAQRMRIRELVSQFTTPHACCQPRVTNIQRAAAILDGQIIPAGGTFSLNTALGERTRARGFVSAPQIGEGGVLEDAVGGGVSQTAHDGLQRGLLRRAEDRHPHAARVLDHALPGGPRGDGLVGRPRADRPERLAGGDPGEGLRHRHVPHRADVLRQARAAASAPRPSATPWRAPPSRSSTRGSCARAAR